MIQLSINVHALAVDYDDTLATEGAVHPAVLAGLERLKRSGRRLLLVTGRELDDLQRIFAGVAVFDRVVAENGALLFRPQTGEAVALGAPPAEAFVRLLREQGVSPLSVGRVIVATTEPHQAQVVDAIRQLGLELTIIFNKGAVMVLPTGIDKASGLLYALEELTLSPEQVVGVGDAENDHAFLDACGWSVAVANALPSLKERATWVTESPAGAGVLEVIERLLSSDPAHVDGAPTT